MIEGYDHSYFYVASVMGITSAGTRRGSSGP